MKTLGELGKNTYDHREPSSKNESAIINNPWSREWKIHLNF